MASSGKKRKHHPLEWVLEPVMEEPSYFDRPMFGCLAVYLHGRLMLLLCSGKEPWNGLLIPTDHQFHAAISGDFSDVVQHPVLKKWLYLAEASEDFETTASEILEAVRLNDMRFGVEPKERRQKKQGQFTNCPERIAQQNRAPNDKIIKPEKIDGGLKWKKR